MFLCLLFLRVYVPLALASASAELELAFDLLLAYYKHKARCGENPTAHTTRPQAKKSEVIGALASL